MTPRRLVILAVVSYLLGAAAVAIADDVKISQDFLKEVKNKGRQKAKERAEFWAAKNVTGKDLFWLGRMWDEAGEEEKAIASYDEFLKAPDGDPKNRQVAAWQKVKSYGSLRQWPKVVEAAAAFRKEFPESSVVNESYDEEGKAERIQGNRDKAYAAFKESSDRKFTFGTFNLVDLLIYEGKIDEAKAFMKTAIEEAAAGKDKSLKPMAEVLEWIGTPAPKLEGAVSVGQTEAPTDTFAGTPTLLYYWHLLSPSLDAGFRGAERSTKVLGDKARIVAITHYTHYNPTSHKVEEDLAPETEAGFLKAWLAQNNWGIPAIVLPEAQKGAWHLGVQNGQKMAIDKAGKFRWARIAADQPYDWYCAEEMMKKLAAE